jgi:hypothetical protein
MQRVVRSFAVLKDWPPPPGGPDSPSAYAQSRLVHAIGIGTGRTTGITSASTDRREEMGETTMWHFPCLPERPPTGIHEAGRH